MEKKTELLILESLKIILEALADSKTVAESTVTKQITKLKRHIAIKLGETS